MAKATLNLPLNLSFGDYSIYPVVGLDKLVVRAKHGPSKKEIEEGAQYAPLRRSQSEFNGIGKAASLVINSMYAVKHLKDRNFSGTISKVIKIIQGRDDLSPKGKRSILFSKYGDTLKGFNCNRSNPFDTIVQTTLEYTLSRDECKSAITIPALIPGINFFNPWNLPVCRFITGLGIIPDMVFSENGYVQLNPLMKLYVEQNRTGWISSKASYPGTVLEVQLTNGSALDASGSLVLSVGIEFGTVVTDGLIQPVKYMGSGKVLALTNRYL